MITYSQISYGIEKRKNEKPRESFEDLVAIGKEVIGIRKNKRMEKHYTFTQKGLDIIKEFKLKHKIKNINVAIEALIALELELSILGVEFMKALVLLEKIKINIENTTLNEKAKEIIITDVESLKALLLNKSNNIKLESLENISDKEVCNNEIKLKD